MYDYGKGVAQDKTKAIKWYLRAAKQGHVVAQFNLGFM
jgi:TPR repeat protein